MIEFKIYWAKANEVYDTKLPNKTLNAEILLLQRIFVTEFSQLFMSFVFVGQLRNKLELET